jgi:hypothetical protein
MLSIALFVAALTASGCSGRDAAPVSGKISAGGQPLPGIRVLFQPMEKEGDPNAEPGDGSYGLTGSDGRYTLRFSDDDQEGAVVGLHRVILSDQQAETEEDAGPTPQKRSRIPASFSDGTLTFEVKPGGTDAADFEIPAAR